MQRAVDPRAQAAAHAQAHAQAQAAAQAQAQAVAAQQMRKRNAQDAIIGEGLHVAKRGRPTDRALPPHVRDYVPESAMYNELRRMEKKLDWTIARKRAELTEGFNKVPKLKRTLRIFLSNTSANQPWQKADEAEKQAAEGGDADKSEEDKKKDAEAAAAKAAANATDAEAPSWTLRIEGRLLDPSFRSRSNYVESIRATQQRIGANKFSNLVKSCLVEIQRDPALYPDGSNIVEWNRSTPTAAPHQNFPPGSEPPLTSSADVALDGFEVKRKGSEPVKVRIALYLAHQPEKFSLSPDLAKLLDIQEETRTNVITALWAYIKERRLLDENDRRVVKCDAALQSIFKCPSVKFHHVPEVLNRHLHPPQPVVLEYWVRTDKAENKSEVAYDVEIEMEDITVRQKQHEILAKFHQNADASRQIADLDDRISQAAQAVRNHATTRDFLSSFARDPHAHIRTWLASQARDLDAILGSTAIGANGVATGIGAEEIRRAETFKGSWVEEAVIVNESQRLAERLQELQAPALGHGPAAQQATLPGQLRR